MDLLDSQYCEPQVLQAVDIMVGSDTSSMVRFLGRVRDHPDLMRGHSNVVTNFLRLILSQRKYCQYPFLDAILIRFVQKKGSPGSIDATLLQKTLACEALRSWLREMSSSVQQTSSSSSSLVGRERAVSAAIAAVDADEVWDSAPDVYAAYMNSNHRQMPSKQQSASELKPVAAEKGEKEGEAVSLSTAESDLVMRAMALATHVDPGGGSDEDEGVPMAAASSSTASKRARDSNNECKEDGQASSSSKRGKLAANEGVTSSYSSVLGNGSSGTDSGAVSGALAPVLVKCAAVKSQIDKVSSGLSGASSARQLSTACASALKTLLLVGSLDCTAEQARCLTALSLWRASDDVLEGLAGSLMASDQCRSASIVLFLIGALLPKIRISQSIASRVLVRALEAVAKKRADLVIHCVLSRGLCVWPVITGSAIALNTTEAVLATRFSRKCALELLLRMTRLLPASANAIVAALCVAPSAQSDGGGGDGQLTSSRDAALAQTLDACVSPVAVLGAPPPVSMTAGGPAGKKTKSKTPVAAPASSSALDRALREVWKPACSTSSSSPAQSCVLGIGHWDDPELLKALNSVLMLVAPRTLSAPTLRALLTAVGSIPAGRLPGGAAQALCTLLTTLLSRHRADVQSAGLEGDIRALASRVDVTSSASWVLRLLDSSK
jgi:hypothetical protein